MLFLIKKKKKIDMLTYIGDKLNLIYRFNGVFFVMMGICIYNRKKTISIFAKKKSFYIFFSLLYLNLKTIYKFESFFFAQKK